MSILKENTQELYAIDVAFHEAGLNYGDKNETASRVVKKQSSIKAIEVTDINGLSEMKIGVLVRSTIRNLSRKLFPYHL